jgi:hypothetical protein
MERGKGSDSPCLLLIYCSSGCVLYIHFNMVSVVLQARATRSKYKCIQQPVIHQVSFVLSQAFLFPAWHQQAQLSISNTHYSYVYPSPDTDKPSFIHNLKHHPQKPKFFKNLHINVPKKILNTFQHIISPELTSELLKRLCHIFPGCPRHKCNKMNLLLYIGK